MQFQGVKILVKLIKRNFHSLAHLDNLEVPMSIMAHSQQTDKLLQKIVSTAFREILTMSANTEIRGKEPII